MKARPINKTFREGLMPVDFFHQGKVGSWKELFQVEQIDYVDKRVHSELSNVGLRFN